MAKMTKAEMDAFKKKNFDLSKKVTKSQLDKLRAEGTPAKAIAKYKNDPSMREALNRFYGKARVGQAPASGSSSTTKPGGPGAKMPKPPAGGPGSKTGRDGRVPASKKTVTMGSRAGGTITVSKAANDKRKAEFQNRTAKAVAVGAAIVPAGKGAMMATAAAKKVAPKAAAAAKKVAPKTTAAAKSAVTKATSASKSTVKKVVAKANPKKGSQ